jgi:hypothetical protein
VRIEGAGELTERDCWKALWLHVRPRPVFVAIGIGLLVLFAVAVAIALADAASGASRKGAVELLVFALAAVALAVWQYRWWIRAIRSQPALRGPHRLVLTETGISGVSEFVAGEFAWGAFIGWREGRDLFLLYSGTQSMHTLPKRWFGDDAAVGQVRSLLEALPLPRRG